MLSTEGCSVCPLCRRGWCRCGGSVRWCTVMVVAAVVAARALPRQATATEITRQDHRLKIKVKTRR